MTSENMRNLARTLSPTGSDSSTCFFKRPREEEVDSDETSRLRSGRARSTKPNWTALMKSLNNISSTLTQHGELLSDIPFVKQQLSAQGEVLKELSAMKVKLDSFCNDVVELRAQCDAISKDNVSLKRDVAELRGRLDNASAQDLNNTPGISNELSRLAAATNSNTAHLRQVLSRQSHINEFFISGFSFVPERAYNHSALVSAVTGALNVKLEPGDIVNVRTMKPWPAASSSQTNQSASSSTAGTEAQRMSIVFKCTKPNIVHQVINAKRNHGVLKLSHLDVDAIAALDLPKPNGDHRIFVNELLPSHTYKLLGSARKILKALGFKFIWCRGDTVFAKFDESSVVHTLLATEDLDKLRLLIQAK